jgi:hypothetical protein
LPQQSPENQIQNLLMLLADITTSLKQGVEEHSGNPGGLSHEIDGQSVSIDHSTVLLPMTTTGKGAHEGRRQDTQTWISPNSFAHPQAIL